MGINLQRFHAKLLKQVLCLLKSIYQSSMETRISIKSFRVPPKPLVIFHLLQFFESSGTRILTIQGYSGSKQTDLLLQWVYGVLSQLAVLLAPCVPWFHGTSAL